MEIKLIATVLDDEGGEHEIVAYMFNGDSPPDVVRQEALERGIRYASIVGIDVPAINDETR